MGVSFYGSFVKKVVEVVRIVYSECPDTTIMDKYRLVPNVKPYYVDNNYMNYQSYGGSPPFFGEGGEQSSQRQPSSQHGNFQYGDGRMPAGILPAYDPFANEDSLLLDSEIKKSLDYIQHQQQIAQDGGGGIPGQVMRRGATEKGKRNAKPKTATPSVMQDSKKIKKNGKAPAGKQKQQAKSGDERAAGKDDGTDQLEVKRMKRLLRNRVSAQLARERKKQYVLGLEKKSKESDRKIKELQDKVKALASENEALRRQLGFQQQEQL